MCPFEFVEGCAKVVNTGRYYTRQIRLNFKALVLAGRVWRMTRSLRAQKAQVEQRGRELQREYALRDTAQRERNQMAHERDRRERLAKVGL